jgi:hypothetical protein
MKNFKELREHALLSEAYSKAYSQRELDKLRKKYSHIGDEEAADYLDNKYSPLRIANKKGWTAISYPVRDGDYYFALIDDNANQKTVRDANTAINIELKGLVETGRFKGDPDGLYTTLMQWVYNNINKKFGYGDTMTREEIYSACKHALGGRYEEVMTDEEVAVNDLRIGKRKLAPKIRFKKGGDLGEETTSVSEKAYDKNDVKKVEKLEKKLQSMLKEVEKTMRGSGLSAPAFNNVRSGIVKGLESIQKFYKIANNSKANEDTDVQEAYKDPSKSFPRDREWKALCRKHKRHIMALQNKGKDLPANAEEDFVQWGMENGEINDSDDIEKFIEDELLNASYSPTGNTISEKYRSKFKSSDVAKAVEIAHSMSGNMTGAFNKIEKIKRGLGDDPIVAIALKTANEAVN